MHSCSWEDMPMHSVSPRAEAARDATRPSRDEALPERPTSYTHVRPQSTPQYPLTDLPDLPDSRLTCRWTPDLLATPGCGGDELKRLEQLVVVGRWRA